MLQFRSPSAGPKRIGDFNRNRFHVCIQGELVISLINVVREMLRVLHSNPAALDAGLVAQLAGQAGLAAGSVGWRLPC